METTRQGVSSDELDSRQADTEASPDVPEHEPGETGKYIYCIIRSESDREFGPIGIGDDENRVHTLRHEDLAAVVSDTPIRIYDPTRENVLAHETVNKTVMSDHTVIPMSFGTIFRTEEDVLALLESTYEALDDVLEKMEDKIELGLKVLWDQEKVEDRVVEESEEVRRLQEEVDRSREGSTYFARVQLGRMVESALEERANRYVSDIYDALASVAVASRSNKPIGDRMILNAAFLVDRDSEEDFDRVVQELSDRYGELLSFTYTGPWPPYNFVNVKLRLERAEE